MEQWWGGSGYGEGSKKSFRAWCYNNKKKRSILLLFTPLPFTLADSMEDCASWIGDLSEAPASPNLLAPPSWTRRFVNITPLWRRGAFFSKCKFQQLARSRCTSTPPHPLPSPRLLVEKERLETTNQWATEGEGEGEGGGESRREEWVWFGVSLKAVHLCLRPCAQLVSWSRKHFLHESNWSLHCY